MPDPFANEPVLAPWSSTSEPALACCSGLSLRCECEWLEVAVGQHAPQQATQAARIGEKQEFAAGTKPALLPKVLPA
jgi:hypothetical protein